MTEQNEAKHFSIEFIQQLSDSVRNTSIHELELMLPGKRIVLKRQPEINATSGISGSLLSTSTLHEKNFQTIISPYVGIFFTHHPATSQPYINPGSTVKKGQMVALVQVAGFYRPVRAHFEGVISTPLVVMGDAVEFGTLLFKIT